MTDHDSLAELITRVNALPTAAMLQAVAHLRTFYAFPDIHPDDMPDAMAALASFGAPQAAVPAETGGMAHGASASRSSSEALGEWAAGGEPPKGRLWPWESGERPAGWWCSHCGYHPGSRETWCEGGCGSDYNKMTPMTANEVAEATGIAKRASTDRESRTIEGGIAEQGRETGSDFAKRELLSRSARDDSAEARADRLAAGVATIRLTRELCALHDLAPRPGFP